MSARSPCPVSRRIERNTGKACFPRVSRSMTSCRACSTRLPALCREGKPQKRRVYPGPRHTTWPALPTGTQRGETWGSTLSTSAQGEQDQDPADMVTETPSSHPNPNPGSPPTTKPCCRHKTGSCSLPQGLGGEGGGSTPSLSPQDEQAPPRLSPGHGTELDTPRPVTSNKKGKQGPLKPITRLGC